MPTKPNPCLPVAPAARLFRLLADGTRLRLLLLLAAGEGDLPVAALATVLGLSPTALSRHLTLLRLAGVVTARREGHNVFYALGPGPARAILLRHVRP
jgi:DNA-binding transcriptional ArsR family regulator